MRFFSVLVIGCLSLVAQCLPVFQNLTSRIPKLQSRLLKRAAFSLDRVHYLNCDSQQIDILRTTVSWVYKATKQMETDFNKNNPYVQAFWPAGSMTHQWIAYGKEYYKRMNSKLRVDNDNANQLTFDCKPNCPGAGAVAYAVPELNIMGFCASFFDDFKNVNDIPCVEGTPLGQYDARERALIHELSHTRLAPQTPTGKYPSFPLYEGVALDVNDRADPSQAAYGVENAKSLAAGKLWGWEAKMARRNADNWALMVWGTKLHQICAAKTQNSNFDMPITG